MMEQGEFDEHYAASQIARRDSGLRARFKRFYLDRILRFATGVTVDIGCGAGQLLEQLPKGSIGLEINPTLVRHLRAKGLDVLQATPSATSISLGALRPSRARAAVLSHVLEHFDEADEVLRRLMRSCTTLGISRLIVVVPGWVGYGSDNTHRTFVTLDYLRAKGLLEGPGFRAVHHSYFPGNLEAIGRVFVYHELMVVYDLVAGDAAPLAPTSAVPPAATDRKAALIQFAKFLVVGLVNTAFSYGIYAGLVYLRLNYALANLVALVLGMAFSFKMQGALVFANSENRRIFRFVAVWVAIYAFNIFVISRFLSLGFNSYVSGAMAIPFSTVISFVAQKFFVFRAKD